MSANAALLLLAATLPLVGAGWAVAILAERLKVDAKTRSRLWLAALLAPLALAPALFLAQLARPLASPAPAPAAIASIGADHSTPVPPKQHPSYAVLALALLAGGAVVRLGAWAERLRRSIVMQQQAEPAQDPALARLLAAQAARLGVKPPGIRLWDGAQPVLIGLVRPAILLPRRLAAELDQARLGLILAHELGHLRTGDAWRMTLADLLCAVMWFNPFARAAYAGLAQAREEVCDALALQGLGRPQRRAYAETLLAALRQEACDSPALAFIGARRRAMQRMGAILKPSPASPRRVALCAGMGALTLSGGLAGLAYAAAGILPAPARPVATPPQAGPQPVAVSQPLNATATAGVRPLTAVQPSAAVAPSTQAAPEVLPPTIVTVVETPPAPVAYTRTVGLFVPTPPEVDAAGRPLSQSEIDRAANEQRSAAIAALRLPPPTPAQLAEIQRRNALVAAITAQNRYIRASTLLAQVGADGKIDPIVRQQLGAPDMTVDELKAIVAQGPPMPSATPGQ